jgi:hypothetical protein
MEHRWGQRFAVDIPVQVACRPAIRGTGHVVDISMSGAFVMTDLQPPLFGQVQIALPTSERRQRLTWLEGFVVRHSHAGIGIEWSSFAPAELTALLARWAPEHEAPLRVTLDHYRRSVSGTHRP